MTLFRCLSEHGYYTSYNFNRRNFTIAEVVKFDRKGLWNDHDVRFSKHGTLKATIRHSLEDASTHIETEMAKMPTLSDDDLWSIARSQMRAEDEALLHDLLDLKAEQKLSTEETQQLKNLHHEVGRLLVLKSQAYALLHERGHSVPQS